MKKIFLLISLLWSGYLAVAYHENPSFQWSPSSLIVPSDGPLVYSLYDPAVYRSDGTAATSALRFRVRESEALVTLFTNPYLATPYPHAYSVSIKFKITYKDLSGIERSTDDINLRINYDPERGRQYQAKDSYRVPNAHYATIKINSVIVTNADGTALPVASLDNLFFLRFQLQVERYYEPQRTIAPSINLIKRSQDNGHLLFSWRRLPWAEKYDVEWVYVDDYNYTTGGAVPRTGLPYRFKNNSTRISTKTTSYEIPLIFERGYIIFRVRGVGLWGEDFMQEIAGKWSLPDAGNQIPSILTSPSPPYSEIPNGVFQVTEFLQHDAHKNWQYKADFSEDGKRIDAINYRDGTLRSRQALTNLSSTKHVVVGEVIYDHQGRPAVEVLPSPYQPVRDPSFVPSPYVYQSDQPPLQYVSNYNVVDVGTTHVPYRREHFDKDHSEGCELSVVPLGTSKGTGNYFSSSNPDLTQAQAYVPDANGFPFKHTEFTPDKSGRIRRQGQVGESFQLGRGHEVKYYYATPSQPELDRIFGNEAGVAAHYKKEMTLDPNGQAHISYKDSKGRTIATALAGQAPANLDAIEAPTPQAIVINLLEEENRRETGTASLISSRSITISQPTTITFQYQLTPATYAIDACPVEGSLCYDCVYDLRIQVYDDCGIVLYDVSQPIGTLDSMRSCNPISFTSNRDLALVPGSYTVAKRLSVNSESIDHYMQDFLSLSCFRDLQQHLREAEEAKVDSSVCEAQCKTCSHTELQANYTVTQADGSEREISVPVEVRNQNDGTCVNTCSTCAGGCNVYYESMLADVSPSGQYAWYRDDSRRDTDPLGEIDPGEFPLSILNEANLLPVRHVSWRTPVFDYRNANGDITYIEINESGLPSHMAREIEIRDGKRYVKPQYLNDVKDFIAYWQPSWAESLVPYHPEYQYYLWCRKERDSHQYDSIMQNTKTYSEAAANNMINHLTLSLANDPFFVENPSAIPMMMDSLNHFFKMDTLSRPVFNIDETAYMVINCNNINFTDTQVVTCARGMSLYTNPARADKEWELYKELYLSMKRKVMDVVRHREVIAAGGFNNLCIGLGVHSSLFRLFPFGFLDFVDYADKTRRFVDAQDAFTYRPVDPTDPTSTEEADSWRSFIRYAGRAQYQRCGTCPVANDFLALLNGFSQERKLTQMVNLPDAPPLTLTRALVDAFSIHDALSYSWNPSVSGNELKIEMKTKGKVVCSFDMKQEGTVVDWNRIRYFMSLTATGSNKFKLRALTDDGQEVIITGLSSCLDFAKCGLSPVCKATPLLHEMQTFMGYLLTNGRYQQSSLRVYTDGENSPVFGPGLRAQHAGFKTWDWQYTGLSGGIYSGKLVISKPGPLSVIAFPPTSIPITEICNFTFQVQKGYDLTDVFRIVEIRRATVVANGQQACEQYNFVLVAVNTKGIKFTIQVSNTCYVVGDCCSQPTASCDLPFTPRIPLINPCLENAIGQAHANAKRIFDDSVRSEGIRVRNAYVEHCLNAAEQFTLTYSENIYQYTLYYYDQSGNLVQTVSPKGVDVLDASELNRVAIARTTATPDDNVYPNHQLKTVYEYNTLNQVLLKTTPDGGTIKYCYDALGRVILSQTAQQASEATCSYLVYDALGKVIESGKLTARPGDFPSSLTYSQFQTEWLSGMRTEIFKTYYDNPIRDEISTWFHNEPLYLRNRVAAVTYQESSGSSYDHATHYKYDILGNINALIQENALLARTHPAIADAGHHIKQVKYDYDLASGNVHRVIYQPYQRDQFIHEYEYDADNRLVSVRTSTHEDEDELVKDIDATFEYYQHGPLARQTLGMEKVQGLDFAYTLQGWLKGVNASTLSPYRDIGRDATTTGAATRGVVGQDAFGYALQYFIGDYKPIDATITETNMFTPTTTGSALESPSLYDGNISHQVMGNDAFADNKVQAQTYHYDQLARLTDMSVFRKSDVMVTNAWSGGSFVNDYHNDYGYDHNGNITHLTRQDGAGIALDDLTYQYTDQTNQLSQITEPITTTYPLDLENQDPNNYRYDQSGRLIGDAAEGIRALSWTHTDKIKEINKNDSIIHFTYDSFGQRITKTTSNYTLYDVRDNAGKVLATYEIKDNSIVWQGSPIYSDKRIGAYQPNLILNDDVDTVYRIQRRGLKHYELTDQVGNICVTVTDRKVPSILSGGIFYSDISSAHDYYPFGMTMPNRNLDTLKYAFGYQGMRRDDELKGKGNSYTTEFRSYDPRVGRWLSLDPLLDKFPSYSPYTGLENNPIMKTDPDGSETQLLRSRSYDRPATIPYREVDTEHYAHQLMEDSRALFGIELQENNRVLTLRDIPAALARVQELNDQFNHVLAADPHARDNAIAQLREFVETMLPDGTDAASPDGTVYHSRHTTVVLDRGRAVDNSMAYLGRGRDATIIVDPLFATVGHNEYRPHAGSAEGAAFALHPNIDRAIGPLFVFLHERLHNTRGLDDPATHQDQMRLPGGVETVLNGLRRGLGLPTRRVYGEYPAPGGGLLPFDGGNIFIPDTTHRPPWAPQPPAH